MARHVPLILAAGGLVGCSSGESEDATTPAETSAQTVEIVGTDFAFEPATIQLKSGRTYTFVFRNEGQTDHSFEIVEGTDVIGGAYGIAPGEIVDDMIVEFRAGQYEMYCPIKGHRGFGMEGTIVVGRREELAGV